MKLRELISHIKNVVNNKTIILFGNGLTKILLNKKIHTLDIFIECDKEKEDINSLFSFLPYISTIRYHLDTSFDKIEKSSITINNTYLDINDIKDECVDIKPYIKFDSKHYIKDINKKVINFTKNAQENFKPEYIFEAFFESIENNFLLSSKAMDVIIKNKHLVKNLYKRQIYSQLLLSLKCSKPQKFLEMMNILGISNELFNKNIVNNLSYRYLEKTDVPEFLFSLFNFSSKEEYQEFLSNKCGVLDKELNDCLLIYETFSLIDPLKNPLTTAEEIFNKLKNHRVLNFCRLLNIYKMNDISRILKKMYFKNITEKSKKLILKPKHIKLYFGIDNKQDIDIILNEAQKKIEEDPSSNKIDVLIPYLKERMSIC